MKDALTDSQKGISTLEMLIALALLVLTFTAVISVVFANQTFSVDAQTNNEALHLAQAQIEDARSSLRKNFFALTVGETETAGPFYTQTLTVADNGNFSKKITGRVTWPSSPGRAPYVQLTTVVTDWQSALSADTCSQTLSGDWTQPQMVSYEFGKVLLNDPNSDYVINDLDVLNKKLYAATAISHSNNTNTFFIFDLTDPVLPSPIVGIPNDPNPLVKAGINALQASGNYAYAAKATGPSNGQLQVIFVPPNVSQANPPQVKVTFKVPGVTGTGSQSIGQSIFYRNGYVYLGLAKTLAGPEFNIIDVTDPLAPVWKGGYNVGNGVNAVFVKDHYAYLATPNSQELITLDLSDPSNPAPVGGFDAPGGGGNFGNGKSIYSVGNTLYLGRTLLLGNELYILDNADPETNLPTLGSKDIKNGNNNASVNGIVVRDYLAFLIAAEQFQIWKIDKSTIPWTLTQWAAPLSFPTQGGGSSPGTTTDCEENILYAGSVPSGNKKGSLSIISPGP